MGTSTGIALSSGLCPGGVVLLPFPFSDLSETKLRPALLIAETGRGDWICCQITSQPYADPQAVEIDDNHFAKGSLRRISYVRPGKLFTANRSLFRRSLGLISANALESIRKALIAIISSPAASA
ncbi:PemK-like protein [Thiorhodovibrio frisius]|uniref:PemK-like protein n=1 Tax=Thiorhodovibrio frisius TaxID=631362 RepID=H8Z531_9GAMM|nr:PemK-like protein [Thiorhodovibrio frisius]